METLINIYVVGGPREGHYVSKPDASSIRESVRAIGILNIPLDPESEKEP